MKINILKLKEQDIVAYNLLKASWLQKAIRRGDVETSLYIAQLYLNDNQQNGLYRKLLVFLTEDVGLACPEGFLIIDKFKDDILKQVALLALMPKNREVDRFLLGVRDHYHFLKQQPEISNEVETLNKVFLLADQYYSKKNKDHKNQLVNFFNTIISDNIFHKEITEKTLDNYFLLTKHNSFGARTALAFLVLLNLRKIDISNFQIPVINIKIVEKPIVDDYALDKHTSFGKMLKRGEDHWLQVGSVVFNEIHYASQYLKNGKEKYPYVIKYDIYNT